MDRVYTNTQCPLYESEYCTLLHMESCESCTVHTADAEQVRSLTSDLDVTASLMPREGIWGLFATDECMLCKGENKGARAYYAATDIGNREPKHVKRSAIGIKTVARTGSLVPVQVSCCSDCRKRILMIEYLPTVLMVAICALALLLMSIRPLRESFAARFAALPLLIFAVVAILAWIFGRVLRKRLLAEAEAKTYLRVFDLPQMAGMRERGWFELNEGKGGITRYIFAKKRIRQGLYTGIPADGAAAQKNI